MKRFSRATEFVRCGIFAATVFILTGCGSSSLPKPASIEEIKSPAGTASRASNLSVGPDGETYLSWIEVPDSGAPALKFAVKSQAGWSEPRTVTQGEDLIVNEADFPSVMSFGKGLLAAHWMKSSPEGEGYEIRIAVSQNNGQTWSNSVVPHRDGTHTEHGFVSIAPGPNGGVSAIWLDSRKLSTSKSDEVSVMSAPIAADGTLGAESEIDGRACECCQTSAAIVPGGV